MKEETYSSSSEDLSKKVQRERESILKRIPADAEATTVLVGTVDFLQEPAIAFVRLAESIFLSAVTEVNSYNTFTLFWRLRLNQSDNLYILIF